MLNKRIYYLFVQILFMYIALGFSSLSNSAECISRKNILDLDYLQLQEENLPPCDDYVKVQISYLLPYEFGPPIAIESDNNSNQYYASLRQALHSLEFMGNTKLSIILLELSTSRMYGENKLEVLKKIPSYKILTMSLLNSVLNFDENERNFSDQIFGRNFDDLTELDWRKINHYCIVRSDIPGFSIKAISKSNLYNSCIEERK